MFTQKIKQQLIEYNFYLFTSLTKLKNLIELFFLQKWLKPGNISVVIEGKKLRLMLVGEKENGTRNDNLPIKNVISFKFIKINTYI